MISIHSRPTAVLLSRDREPMVVTVTDPPLPTYKVPLPAARMSPFTEDAKNATVSPRAIEFVLQPRLRHTGVRWMRVYNEGRSQTPENAYVYFERVPLRAAR